MEDFTTIFEIATGYTSAQLIGISKIVIGAIILLVGVAGIVIQIARRRRSFIEFFVQFILVLIACFWLYYLAVPSFVAATKLSNELANAYKSNKYKVAEGYVHVLHKQPKTGHSKGDIVVVDGVEFEIDYFSSIDQSYNTTIAYGGALKEGEYVRLFYYHDKILRIDKRL